MDPCECGFRYVVGHPEDEEQHAHIHAEYLSGPVIPVVHQVLPIAIDGALTIHLVDGTCPISIRRSFAHVAMVAQRSMPRYPSGYDGTVTEDDQRLYVAADGEHIVAMVLTSFDDRFWRLAWRTDGSIELVDQTASDHQSQKIARVWTAAAYRRKGLACRLVATVSRLLPCDLNNLGWELPFTPGGARVVKRLCPESFWGRGDTPSLREALSSTPSDH